METKLSKVIAAWRKGDFKNALRLVAKFPQLGDEKEAITRGWQAVQSPEFYVELGQNPDVLYAEALAAMRRRYPYLDEDGKK